MLMPDQADPTRPKFSMEEVVNLYLENGDAIFKKPFGHKLRTVFGIKEAKYPNRALLEALEKYFGNIYLSELMKPCLFTSYDIESRNAKFFKHGYACKDEAHDFFVKDLAQATAAAPTYFEAALIKSRFGSSYPLIDGGVFANNPAMCAYAEVRKCTFEEIENPTSKDMLMISLGTGSVKEEIPYSKARRFGLVQWIRPLIDVMMSGNSETVSHQLEWLFDAGNNRGNFIRVEPELHDASPDMDDASPKNLMALQHAAVKFVKDNPEKINDIVNKLINNKNES